MKTKINIPTGAGKTMRARFWIKPVKFQIYSGGTTIHSQADVLARTRAGLRRAERRLFETYTHITPEAA